MNELQIIWEKMKKKKSLEYDGWIEELRIAIASLKGGN